MIGYHVKKFQAEQQEERMRPFAEFCKAQQSRLTSQLFPTRCAWRDGLDNVVRVGTQGRKNRPGYINDSGAPFLPADVYDIERRA